MKIVALKILRNGMLTLVDNNSKPGPDNLIYQINNVPDDLSPTDVAKQVNKICFLHKFDDLSSWIYDWAEISSKKQGEAINRYRCTQ